MNAVERMTGLAPPKKLVSTAGINLFGKLETEQQQQQNHQFVKYSQLPLRQTRSRPAPTVHLREVSTLEGDEVNN